MSINRKTILSQIANLPQPWSVSGDCPEWGLVAEFEQCGFIEGKRLTGAGAPNLIVVTGLTNEGFVKLEQLKEETTSIGILTKHKWKIYGSILLVLLTAIISKILN